MDQIGIFFDNAKAKYSSSFGSGQISFALVRDFSNLDKGINFILENIRDRAKLIDSSSNFDFSIITFLYLFVSSNKYSGANKVNSFRKINSRVFPYFEISSEITIFASITSSIMKSYIFYALIS